MTAFNPLGVISDPDQLSATVKLTTETRAAGDEVFIDTTTRTIQLAVDGNLTTDGLTLKCLYSFLKDRWKDNADLIKFPFPMTPITDEQFEFFNGWNLDKVTQTGIADQTSPQLIRTGGWAVKNFAGNVNGNDIERWACVITLGALGVTDQVYFNQEDGLTVNNTSDFILTNTVNQAVQYYRDDDGDGITAENDDYDYSNFLKVYVREWQKTYASSALTDIGVTSLNYQAYRFPLTNSADTKIVSIGVSESAASGNSFTITAATWSTGIATFTSTAHRFIVGDSVDIANVDPVGYNGTFEIVDVPTADTFTVAIAADPGTYNSGGTVSGTFFNNISITWYAAGQQFAGFQNPTTAYFSVVIDADVANSLSIKPTAEQIYAFTQAQLRKTTNINAGSISESTGNKIGLIVPEKLRFVGDDLFTSGSSSIFEGVYINDYNDADVNRLHFWGYGSAAVESATISTIARASNVVTVVTSAAHGFTSGDTIRISGVTSTTDEFNGVYTITVSDTTTFTFSQTGDTESGTVGATSLASPAEYTDIQFPFIALLTLNFGQNLIDDAEAIYRVFFTNDDAGDNTGRDFGTKDAILVNDADDVAMSNTISGNSTVQLTFDYDGNTQRGSASAGFNAPVTAVAIGLTTAQYVIATGTIQRSIANSISLVAPLERNYEPGSV